MPKKLKEQDGYRRYAEQHSRRLDPPTSSTPPTNFSSLRSDRVPQVLLGGDNRQSRDPVNAARQEPQETTPQQTARGPPYGLGISGICEEPGSHVGPPPAEYHPENRNHGSYGQTGRGHSGYDYPPQPYPPAPAPNAGAYAGTRGAPHGYYPAGPAAYHYSHEVPPPPAQRRPNLARGPAPASVGAQLYGYPHPPGPSYPAQVPPSSRPQDQHPLHPRHPRSRRGDLANLAEDLSGLLSKGNRDRYQ